MKSFEKEFGILKNKRLPEPMRKKLNAAYEKKFGSPILLEKGSTFGDAMALRVAINIILRGVHRP